jgi:hypothetical protein
MWKCLPMLGATIALSLSSAALAAPATKDDLSGKTICWEQTGNKATFAAGGVYQSTLFGNGTWAVTPTGVQVVLKGVSNLTKIEKLEDGTFTSAFFNRNTGKFVKTAGKYCN